MQTRQDTQDTVNINRRHRTVSEWPQFKKGTSSQSRPGKLPRKAEQNGKPFPIETTTRQLSRVGSEPGMDKRGPEAISRSWDPHRGCQVWRRPRGLYLGDAQWQWHSRMSSSAGRTDGGGQPGGGPGSLSSRRPRGQQEWRRLWSLFQLLFQKCSGLPHSLFLCFFTLSA